MRERPEVYDVMGQLDRLTARQLRLAWLAETHERPPELSEWEAVLLVRWAEFAVWLDLRELRKAGIDL